MKSMDITRRQFLKGTGALIDQLQYRSRPPAKCLRSSPRCLPATSIRLPSTPGWRSRRTVSSLFTPAKSRSARARSQLWPKSSPKNWTCHSPRSRWTRAIPRASIEQGSTVGSRTIERAGPQIRQAAAAARQELLKLAAARLSAPIDKLTVVDGVVSVAGDAAKKVSYGQLIGGKKFNTKITASGTGWDMKVAPEVKAKDPKQLQNRRPIGETSRDADQSDR